MVVLDYKIKLGVPVVAQMLRTRLASMRRYVQSLASLSGLRIRHCHKPWCRSSAASLIPPLSRELPYAPGAALKRKKKKKEKKSYYLFTHHTHDIIEENLYAALRHKGQVLTPLTFLYLFWMGSQISACLAHLFYG